MRSNVKKVVAASSAGLAGACGVAALAQPAYAVTCSVTHVDTPSLNGSVITAGGTGTCGTGVSTAYHTRVEWRTHGGTTWNELQTNGTTGNSPVSGSIQVACKSGQFDYRAEFLLNALPVANPPVGAFAWGNAITFSCK